MRRLFIFAVGGSGARVLRSFTMLLASGMKLPDCDLVVPYLVDPHVQNKDVVRTEELIKCYNELRDDLHTTGLSPNDMLQGAGFFGQPLRSLTKLSLNTPENQKSSQSFKEYIHQNQASATTQGLLDLLFTADSLDASLDIGFLGSPNVGSVALNSLMQSEEMRRFAEGLTSTDRVFFIGSIFGGTGAAGFPLLVKNLRDPDSGLPQQDIRDKVPAGALVLLPYFKLEQPGAEGKKNIKPGRVYTDSSSFITKTKTALDYYAEHLHGLEALYYLGDGDQAHTPMLNNPEGQRNDAYLLEILGALAIPHFLNQTTDQLKRQTADQSERPAPKYYEFGLKSKKNTEDKYTPVDFSQFSENFRSDVAKPFIRLHYFARYFTHVLYSKDNRKQPFFADGKLDQHLPATTRCVGNLQDMLNKYEQWLGELSQNELRFTGLNFVGSDIKDSDIKDSNFNDMVVNTEIIKVRLFGNVETNLIGNVKTKLRSELNNAVSKKNPLINPDAEQVLRWIVEGFDKATPLVVENKLKFVI